MPILLAAFAVGHGIDDAQRIYETVFVVVLASVVVQGTTVPYAAERLGVPMRRIEPTPHAERGGSGAPQSSVTRGV